MRIYLAEAATGGGVLSEMVKAGKVKYILVSYFYRTGIIKELLNCEEEEKTNERLQHF